MAWYSLGIFLGPVLGGNIYQAFCDKYDGCKTQDPIPSEKAFLNTSRIIAGMALLGTVIYTTLGGGWKGLKCK